MAYHAYIMVMSWCINVSCVQFARLYMIIHRILFESLSLLHTVTVFFCIHQPAYSNQASAQDDGSKPLKSTEETLVGGPGQFMSTKSHEIQRNSDQF